MTEPEVSVIADELDETVEPTIETPLVVAPDRADAPVSEITEKFLRAVVAQIPLERIEELHLFSPLRQSGVETGIAVVAARVPVVAPVVEMAPELALDDDAIEPIELQSADSAELVDVESEADEVNDDIIADAESIEADEAVEGITTEEVVTEELATEEVASEEVASEEVAVDAEGAIETVDDVTSDAIVESSDASNIVASTESIPDAVITPILRHTVYTARYRLVQKGPERGKWESDVVAEADAPLVTVEMVVRGVQRRAGEESEILRYSAKQIAKALRMPWPITPADSPVE